jgi:hypothetical protein
VEVATMVAAALAIGGALTASSLAAGAPADAGPRALLSEIYTHYTDDEAPVLDWNGDDAQRLFEPRLAAAVVADARASGERGEVSDVLDFDPFVQGQDYEIAALKIAVLESQARSARLLVTFRNSGHPLAIHFDLVRLESGWRIRDMRWGQTSLRALYRMS